MAHMDDLAVIVKEVLFLACESSLENPGDL